MMAHSKAGMQAPPDVCLSLAALGAHTAAWASLLACSGAQDVLAFARSCLQPPIAGLLHLLDGFSAALLEAVASCATPSGPGQELAGNVLQLPLMGDALLLLGALCSQAGPSQVRTCS